MLKIPRENVGFPRENYWKLSGRHMVSINSHPETKLRGLAKHKNPPPICIKRYSRCWSFSFRLTTSVHPIRYSGSFVNIIE